MFNPKFYLFTKMCFLTCLSLTIAACGGSGSDGTEFLSGQTDSNVALASAGSSASATYDNNSAENVIDNDTTSATAWAGNISSDTVTVDFGKIRFLKEIRIFTNDTSFNSADPNKLIELSSDNLTWQSSAQLVSGDISCTSLIINSTSISCSYSSRQQARYVRFTNLTTPPLFVYEIQAIGY